MTGKNRRDFLKAGGAAIAGAGAIGMTGTAAASGINFTHVDEENIGDGFGDRGAKIRMLMPQGRSDTVTTQEFDKARGMLRDAYNKSSMLDGVYIQQYTFNGDYFDRYDNTLSRSLDQLDEAGAYGGLDNDNYMMVWDCGDARYHTDDWPSGGDGFATVPYSDPAYSSSRWHPTYADYVTGDGHFNDLAHARVSTPGAEIGRMGHACVVSLTRTRDSSKWLSSDNPPGIYDPDHEWELGGVVKMDDGSWYSDPTYHATAHGSALNTSRLERTDEGTCDGDGLGSDYAAGAEYEEEVTRCTSDTISDAIEWFHY